MAAPLIRISSSAFVHKFLGLGWFLLFAAESLVPDGLQLDAFDEASIMLLQIKSC